MIKAVALDVDGVLTDGSFWWGADGEEFKRFSFADVMGISLGRRAGLLFALISGENSPLVDRFAEKMSITDVYKACKDKKAAIISFARKHNLELSQVCFMGDDVNDLPALTLDGLGLAAAPANGHESVRQKAAVITQQPGGQGAVRELVDILLSRRQPTPDSERGD
jgi:3-deoxy-D-manno-octulosonate 8-phosphate phosphatase (KDO 8-P phosphatase)